MRIISLVYLLAVVWSPVIFAEGQQPKLTDRLVAKGFACEHTKSGDICSIDHVTGSTFHYSQPIAILVPPNLDRPQQIVLHLHGNRGVCELAQVTPNTMVKNFDLLSQLREGRTSRSPQSVLVFPVSTGKCTTFERELAPQFDQFRKWVVDQVNPRNESWVLSGHSGAYRAMGTIMDVQSDERRDFVKKTNGVMMLDSTYADHSTYYDKWRNASHANSSMRVYSVYRKQGGTEVGSRMLKEAMVDNPVHIEETQAEHCKVPSTYIGKYLREIDERLSNGDQSGAPSGAETGAAGRAGDSTR